MYAPLALYDTAAARMLDAQATQLLGGDGYILMQRAGQAAWQCLLERWPRARRLLVVCGTGNNGGDGYVLARLAQRAGRQVQVVHLPEQGPGSPLSQRACTDYLAAGGAVDLFPCPLAHADVIVDALFGIGMNRTPDAETAGLIEAINAAGVPVLALDVPSGLDADRGVAFGAAVRASATLQFIVPHVGLYTGDALEHAGDRVLAPLEVPASAFDGLSAVAQAWTMEALAAHLRPRRRNSHKGESGRVLCIGGNLGSGGAILLTAEAALRSGAGLVQVATRAEHVAPLLTRCPEVMARAVHSDDDIAALASAADALALGPGLGQDDWAQALWRAGMTSETACVLDADGLNLLAAHALPLRASLVLTPHPGEAGRLLGLSTAQVQRDRLSAAAALVTRFGAVVVLKGAGTVVAAPGMPPRIIDAGNAGMAVGGMGDLLTGVIAALLGQGWSPFDAASLGALLHACAGDAAAADGERGLLPTDLLPQLRRLANPGALHV
ncbi:bifunctional ADP-dependent NAD(P)H-hydrate dehydratase/NAD(P)H-hydrate epimerase [Xanthomonas maliensis]|uniref:bifunctional ADP-dependent NAD(P)H-hydrate dehydratase/NAD(P)H-hydrate epimerase n=1 Tax=Xanthomonas maliensis TaxID=1321368 RepID=UPI00039A1648|nr:bifunctional ADP-dependent NAD(P)H-hydrate dehydratase/NAD(P)H-hydrate epimerase [Xanthomonas maliensis]KAB7764858.1 bifunctional ADP-dependent NAD(P)H-hydrate dehydratase/NAD(P)H-hydrate epimerase [Xanthomonas maliensis]